MEGEALGARLGRAHNLQHPVAGDDTALATHADDDVICLVSRSSFHDRPPSVAFAVQNCEKGSQISKLTQSSPLPP